MALPKKGDRLSNRYEIGELLGQGAMGRVYRANDLETKNEVAVKVMQAVGEGSPLLAKRFEREIRTLRRLDHPYILHYRDHGRHGDIFFLVTELLDGRTLQEARDDFLGQPDKVFLLGSRLASAFAAAHRDGVIHRDVKPGNVVLTRSGEPRILDYGLARWDVSGDTESLMPTQEMLTRSNVLLGTVPYMSPEQLRTKRVDLRSDIFSLGVVLYELVAGKRPYSGSTPQDLLDGMEAGKPESLPGIRTDLNTPSGEALGLILERAAHPLPASRFQSMDDFAQALERAAVLHASIPADASLSILLPPSISIAEGGHGSIIGRQREIALLDDYLLEAKRGRGTTVLVEGPAGIGRSRMASQVVRSAHQQGFLCLTDQVSDRPAGADHLPIRAWLERASEIFPKDEEIESALLTYNEVPHDEGGTDPGGARAEALLVALSALSRRMPVLLLLEDIHRAGAGTLEILGSLADYVAPRRAAAVFTLRSDFRSPIDTMTLRKGLTEHPEVQRIDLGPLSADDLRKMGQESYPGLEIRDSFLQELFVHSGGNPTFAKAILRLLEERGELRRDGGDWSLGEVARLDAPPQAHAILSERLAGIADSARELIRGAAVLGESFVVARVAEILDRDVEAVDTELRDISQKERLLIRVENGYRFDQPLTRDLLLAGIPSKIRVRLNRQAAETLEARPESRTDPTLSGQMAHHYKEAGQLAEALPHCIRTGLLLRDEGQAEQAVTWLESAHSMLERQMESLHDAERVSSRNQLAEVLLALGDCLHGMGRHTTSLEVFERARGLAIGSGLDDVRVKSLLGLAKVSLLRGDTLHAQRQARSAAKLARKLKLQKEQALALSVEAHAMSRLDEHDDAEDRWKEATEMLHAAGATDEAIEVQFRLGSHHFRLGRYDEASSQYEQAASGVDSQVNPRLFARIQNARAGVLLAEGNPSKALPIFLEVLAIRKRIGAQRGLATTLHNIAFCRHLLGEGEESCRLYEEVISLRDATGEITRRADSQCTYAEVLLFRGRIEEALIQVTEARATKQRLEDLNLLPPCLTILGEIELEIGRVEHARDAFSEVLRDFEEHEQHTFIAKVGLASVEMLTDELEPAISRLGPLVQEASLGDDLSTKLFALVTAARAHEASRSAPEAVGLISGTLSVLERRDLIPMLRMAMLEAAGIVAKIEGRSADARKALTEALGISRKLEAVERTWRLHRDLGKLEAPGTPGRQTELRSAWRLIEQQSRGFRSQELRDAYLGHRERTTLRQELD